ncbi:D-tyrosyl-tRNA(Tyr) deacylase [Desulfobulbus sp. US1]|nr:D-tyrosyl-tRNA(Tyr) deacylase [Desulfobulbus sp. US4]MCW5205017.1 D-tyrosyl-tRNA(Tyr) deacylase [Desulfobulbus sp. N2]MCW5207303.1 D-tyrosyl-tRNA(Tyr) deacylase [Desulfobulbus sp. US2]MCW5209859.1 D-tyrosyl-tRNA(Tyr) deacylase [Desulfobulbus sp. US1]
MRAVIQRVTSAKVTVDDRQTGAIGEGLLVLLGVHKDDEQKDITWLTDKIINLRIFEDEDGKMNHSLVDTGGSMLIVSQFTLLADCRKGRRPSWSEAAPPDKARQLYEEFIQAVADSGITTATGEFQAMMEVSLVNSGPVTILLDSHKKF